MVTIVWQDMASASVLDMYGQQLERHVCGGEDEYDLNMHPYPDAVCLLEVVSQYGTAYKLVFKSK